MDDRKDQRQTAKRRSYRKPTLLVHGLVEELTKGTTGTVLESEQQEPGRQLL